LISGAINFLSNYQPNVKKAIFTPNFKKEKRFLNYSTFSLPLSGLPTFSMPYKADIQFCGQRTNEKKKKREKSPADVTATKTQIPQCWETIASLLLLFSFQSGGVKK
jgi:hypothetical protein